MCELAFQYFENSLSRLTKPNVPGPSTKMMNQVLTNFYMTLKRYNNQTFLLKEEYGHIWYWASACNNFLHHLSPLSWDSLTLLKVTALSLVSPMLIGRVRHPSQRSTSKLGRQWRKEVNEVGEETQKNMGKEEGKWWGRKETNCWKYNPVCLVSISPALLTEGLPFYVIPF